MHTHTHTHTHTTDGEKDHTLLSTRWGELNCPTPTACLRKDLHGYRSGQRACRGRGRSCGRRRSRFRACVLDGNGMDGDDDRGRAPPGDTGRTRRGQRRRAWQRVVVVDSGRGKGGTSYRWMTEWMDGWMDPDVLHCFDCWGDNVIVDRSVGRWSAVTLRTRIEPFL